MSGPVGLGDPDTERFVKPGEWMTYTVYFENVSNATAAAQEVYVTNPLSEWLDWSTFEMGEVAFNNQIDLGLSGKNGGTSEATMNGTNFIVRTTLALEENDYAGTRDACPYQAKWYLRIVDPTTDTGWPADILAGFLPPNDETFRGEGHLTYRVKVRDDAPANVIITNSATIVFDYKEPIITDPAWWNTVAPKKGGARFCEVEMVSDEGSNAVIRVTGGNAYTNSSVQLYLTYNTAAAADIDLKTGAVGGETPKGGLKFPLTLSWAKGEIGAKTVAIPFKTDKTVEGDEFFTLQLAAPNGMTVGDASVCTVTIRDTTVAAGKETLQDAVNNVIVKMSTAGKGKWAYSSVGMGGEAEPGKTASASAASPALKVGETADLKAGAVKGSGTLTFDVRVANDALEGESPESPDGAAKTVLTLFDGKVALLAWTNETDWTSASYTIDEAKATSHAFTWRVVQGADLGARAYVANVAWSPADTDMRAITLSVEPAEGGTAAGSGVYPDKTKLSLVATAKVGWEFVGWAYGGGRGATPLIGHPLRGQPLAGGYALPDDGEGRAGSPLPAADGEILSNKAKWQVVVTNDAEYVAVFEKIPYVRGLADPADGGKVSGSALCPAGKKVTLKASANKNYTFLGWVRGGPRGTALPGDGDGRADSPLPAADGEFVATTASLVIDRSAKPAANSKTSTTITNVAEDVTYYAVFKSYPEVFVVVDATDGAGAEPTGKGAGKYVAGTITGMGKYAPGKKVTLKAAANKGYVFAGWFDADSELLTKNATYTVASMGEDDVEYTAKFITAAEDKASIALALTMAAEAEALGLSTNEIASVTNFCGVAMSWRLAANALSATTIKVAGLPSGLKFTAKDIMKKGSKTEVNIPANTIYGAPTAASKTDRSGNVTPSKVVFTVTTAGKSTQTFAINLYIDPLPAWAVGTFDGSVSEVDEPIGIVQAFTIAANGKISGKVLGSGLTWSLAATSFDAAKGPKPEVESPVFYATVIGKAGKEIVTNEVAVTSAVVDDIKVGVASSDDWITYQNLWKRADTKTDMPIFKKNLDRTLELGEAGDANNTVKLTFKKDGAVSFAGKVGGASVSGSSQLVNDGNGWKVTLYAPPKPTAKPPFEGWCETLVVTLVIDDQGVVTEVVF